MDDTPSAPSVRERIAALATDAALGVPGVAAVGDETRCIAQPDRRYGVELGLTVSPVPLVALANTVRAAVEEACAGAGLDDELGAVDIVIRDLAVAQVDR